ncbi:TetR/AcrR family transcriptional regulator [Alphaproteobacteria bacterium]|nr:TetR/AcrR family transcriptional regulator [Alphaproteobacteria bacterium]
MEIPNIRTRNPEATRKAIIDAARHCFAAGGYEDVGVREIAAQAGVTAALINRYFGSKEGLFAEAVPPTLEIGLFLDGDMRRFGERAATIMVMKSGNGYDPMLALLRSMGSRIAVPQLRAAIDKQVVEVLAKRLEGPDRLMRAGLIIAQLTGFDVMMRALSSAHMAGAQMTSDDIGRMRDHLAKSIQALVDNN